MSSKKVDILVAEIGSTTTVVNAFEGVGKNDVAFVGQGLAPTTVLEGDVTIGLTNAVKNLAASLAVTEVLWDEMIATSSAAGGLRMTVHGLVYDMTVKAAQEAALGAGAVIKMVTAGELSKIDIAAIEAEHPNIVLLAGGVDYGDKNTVIHNAKCLAPLLSDIPVIYAGNKAAASEVKAIFSEYDVPAVYVDNVYPRIDQLNIGPTRKAIQDVFEAHIIHAPGMSKIREMVSGKVMPTPGAVMQAAELLYQHLGDVAVIDVGGATTDVHSVTPGSEKVNQMLISPEPLAKRTVEGDLGVFVNVDNVVELIGLKHLEAELGPQVHTVLDNWQPIPNSQMAEQVLQLLTSQSIKTAVDRHAGELRHLYGPSGRITIAEGKDLSGVKYLVGTGGPLTQLSVGASILRELLEDASSLKLMPNSKVQILIDRDYIMASCGVLSSHYPDIAYTLLAKSFGIHGEEKQ